MQLVIIPTLIVPALMSGMIVGRVQPIVLGKPASFFWLFPDPVLLRKRVSWVDYTLHAVIVALTGCRVYGDCGLSYK